MVPGKESKPIARSNRGLSESLRGGQLKSIHVPSPIYRELRHLTQLRDTLVSEVAGMKQRIQSLLLFEGIAFPAAPAGSRWSLKAKSKVRKLQCSKDVCALHSFLLLGNLEFSEKQVVKVTKEYAQSLSERS